MKNKTALLRNKTAIKILKRAHSNNEPNSKDNKKTTKSNGKPFQGVYLERALENASQKKLIRKINYDMKNKTALLRIEI